MRFTSVRDSADLTPETGRGTNVTAPTCTGVGGGVCIVTAVLIERPSSAPNGAAELCHAADPRALPPCPRRVLLAELTHDLKNPLAVIRGNAQLLERRLSRPEPIGLVAVRDGLAQIEAATTRMALLLEDLLDAVSSGGETLPALVPGPMD